MDLLPKVGNWLKNPGLVCFSGVRLLSFANESERERQIEAAMSKRD